MSETTETIIKSRKSVKHIIDSFLECIQQDLKDGKKVTLKNVGTLTPKTIKAHRGRNPKTGEVIDIPERLTVKFKPSTNLKNTMNKGE